MKYKVVGKITVRNKDIQWKKMNDYFNFTESDLLAYKIIAGLYIFYITKEVYIEGAKQNIIEPIVSPIQEIPYRIMIVTRGNAVNHRMFYALEHSTIDYLTKQLERAKSERKILTVKTYRTVWENILKTPSKDESENNPTLTYLEEIKVDIENQEILQYKNIKKDTFISIFTCVKTYEDFLDKLVDILDRSYMNSRNIYDKYKEQNFHYINYALQKGYKFEFLFE